MFDGGLLEIFRHEFGMPGAPRFEAARRRFLESCAAYSVATYLLWAKDRHNGNLMLDNQGRLLHIDFGYILGISPGGRRGKRGGSQGYAGEVGGDGCSGNTRVPPKRAAQGQRGMGCNPGTSGSLGPGQPTAVPPALSLPTPAGQAATWALRPRPSSCRTR
jgi:hypothetical protein